MTRSRGPVAPGTTFIRRSPALILPERGGHCATTETSAQMQQGHFGFGFVGGGDGLDADATALIARMTTPPTPGRRTSINNLIKALKSAGVWSKLDALYLFAAADSQAALLNWISTSFNASLVGTVTFTADRGLNQDSGGLTSNYINTNFIPSTASSPKFLLNSAHISAWNQQNGASSDFMMGDTAGGPGGTTFTIRAGPSTGEGRINNSSGSDSYSDSGAGNAGHYILSRTSSIAKSVYRNGTLVGSPSEVSGAVSASTIRCASVGTKIAAASIGSGLNATEASAFSTALQSYMTDVGA